ncbi:MAG TPA: ABC transporter permease [Acidimicrobiales bacterium]|nr:ABC transporter permease [Acidimicrobiales bacterium]
MIVAALRDLQWRRRRVAIAIFGTGLVLAMTMVVTGLSASFHAETARFVDTIDADAYVFSSNAGGPFYGSLPMPAENAAWAEAAPGVTEASPMSLIQAPVEGEDYPQVVLVGVTIGAVGSPAPSTGKALSAPHQAVVSTALGKQPGERIKVGSTSFTITGTTKATLFAGAPVVFVPIADSQQLYMSGANLATLFATRGVPTELPASLDWFDPSETEANLLAPLKSAQQAISFMAYLLWVVAACVLASSMYLSATERTRDFAVFKATGVSNRALLGGLAIQAVIISLVAALIGIVLAMVLAPVFPMNVTITTTAYVALPVVALVVGLLASVVGMRRVTSVDPAAAFAA